MNSKNKKKVNSWHPPLKAVSKWASPSYGCLKKYPPQTWWLKMTEMDSLTLLKASRPKLRCLHMWFLPASLKGNPFCALSWLLAVVSSPCVPWLTRISGSIFTWPSSLCVCVCPLQRTPVNTSHWIGVLFNQIWPHVNDTLPQTWHLGILGIVSCRHLRNSVCRKFLWLSPAADCKTLMQGPSLLLGQRSILSLKMEECWEAVNEEQAVLTSSQFLHTLSSYPFMSSHIFSQVSIHNQI